MNHFCFAPPLPSADSLSRPCVFFRGVHGLRRRLRGTRKREDRFKSVIYTRNEKAVSLVQMTLVILDYDN